MTRDLSDLMAAALDVQEREIAGIAPQPAVFARTVRRVRHRRLVRHSVESSVAVAAVAGLATAGWIGSRYAPPPPAHTPSPTIESPTPTPSTTATPTPVTRPGLPPVLPLPDGLLATTTPGWVLTPDRPVSDDGAVAGQYLVLASPQGERYLVADLSTTGEVRILSWQAGAPTARVLVEGAPASVDLSAGSITPDLRTLPDAVYVATMAGGLEVWMTPSEGPEPPPTYAVPPEGGAWMIGSLGSSSAPVSVSPDGRLLASDTASADAVVVVDATTGVRSVIPFGQPNAQCSTVAWIDATGVLAQCFDYNGGAGPFEWNPRLVRAGLDGAVTVVRQQVAGDPFTSAGAGTYLSDGVVAVAGVPLAPGPGTANACPEGVYLTDGTPVQVSPGATTLAAHGGAVYVATMPGCEAASLPTVLTLHDVASGTGVVLAPAPPDGSWTTGLTSWVVGRG